MKTDMENIVLRKVTAEDKQELIRLRLDFLEELGNIKNKEEREIISARLSEYMNDVLGNEDNFSVFAQDNGNIVGMGGVVVWRRMPLLGLDDGRVGYIINMYTLAEYRGRGIATAILNELIKEAKMLGLKRLHLHATEAGYGVYKSLGFNEPEDCELVLDIV